MTAELHFHSDALAGETELVRHVAFCCRALADRGTLEVRLEGGSGPLLIVRHSRKRLPDLLRLRATTGHLGRNAVLVAAAALDEASTDYKSRRTPKKGLLRDVQVEAAASDPLTASFLAACIGVIFTALHPDEPPRYELRYCGPFESGYRFRDDDPVQPPRAFKLGFKVGSLVGSALGPFRESGED